MITYLLTHLLANASLAALVSTRVWSNVMPQGGTLPAIVFNQTGRVPVHYKGGVDTIVTTRWQFACNSRTTAQARQVADALVDALQIFTRTSAPRVARVWVESISDDVNAGYDSSGDFFRVLVDARVEHEE